MNEVHIPTVGGQSNVLTFSEATEKLYVATVVQAGVIAPVSTIIRNDFSEEPVWTYVSAGLYTLGYVGMFQDYTKVDFQIVGNISFDGATDVVSRAGRSQSNDIVGLKTRAIISSAAGTQTVSAGEDGILNGELMTITDYNPIFTEEEIFDSIISKLDSNQIKIWNKIVIRNNGTVTEVDGRTYRRTNDLISSSKVIQS